MIKAQVRLIQINSIRFIDVYSYASCLMAYSLIADYCLLLIAYSFFCFTNQ